MKRKRGGFYSCFHKDTTGQRIKEERLVMTETTKEAGPPSRPFCVKGQPGVIAPCGRAPFDPLRRAQKGQ